jgi:hypothetical protein
MAAALTTVNSKYLASSKPLETSDSKMATKAKVNSCVLEEQEDGTFLLYDPKRVSLLPTEESWKLFQTIKDIKVYLGRPYATRLFTEEMIKAIESVSDVFEKVCLVRKFLNEFSIERGGRKASNLVTNLAQYAVYPPIFSDQESLKTLETLLQIGLNPNNEEYNDFCLKGTNPLMIIVRQYHFGFTNLQKCPDIHARYRQVVQCLTR